jgi:hypothetical protein
MIVVIILIIFALLLVGVYFLGKSGAFNSKASPEEPKTYDEKTYSMGQNAYLPVSTWSQFEPNDKNTAYSGSCLNYSIKNSTLALGFPSIDDLNNNLPNYIKSTQECVDPDQILAQAGKHTCQNPNNGGGGTGCITSTTFTFTPTGAKYVTGDFVPVGVTEGIIDPTIVNPPNPYYITCGSKACPGEIGLIVPNFTNIINPNITLSTKPTTIDPNSNYPNCLQNNGITEPNTGAFYSGILPCDLSDASQVFRMIRYSFDDNYIPSINPTGIYAAIIHRATGFYLAPDMNYNQSINPITGDFIPNSYTYYFDSLIVNTDPVDSTNKYVNLILINPKYDTVRNGVYWLLQNQTPDATKPTDAININNSLNCDASLVYPISPGADVPGNCLNTGVPPWYNPCNPSANGTCNITLNTDTYIPYSPQQFVYIPNIYLVPKDTTDLIEYWTYLTNQFTIQIGSINELNPNDWRAVDDAYKGLWDSNIIYSFGDIIYYQTSTSGDEGFYVSVNSGDNVGKTPSVTTPSSDWKPIAFDYTTSPSPATVLPLTSNYKGNWSATGIGLNSRYNGPDVNNNINSTGDVVTYIKSGDLYTYIALQNTLNPPALSALPPLIPSPGSIAPKDLPNYPNVPTTTYWQQIPTYSSAVTAIISYNQGQLFADTTSGVCYVYIGSNVVSPATDTLPDLYNEVSNIPMLKKFLTKIPADIYYYSNQGPVVSPPPTWPVPQDNPFWGSSGPSTNVIMKTPFGTINPQYMDPIPDDIHKKYYSGGASYIIAYISPKLTTSVTSVTPHPSTIPTPFNDNTVLLDNQFIGATNLISQLQSPISTFRDPISQKYSAFNPFNVIQ